FDTTTAPTHIYTLSLHDALPISPEDIFTPEDFSEEQTMIRDMTEQFVEDEVLPQIEKIEHKEWDVTVNLLKRCGELGLLGIEVPDRKSTRLNSSHRTISYAVFCL